MANIDIYKDAELAIKNAHGIYIDHEARLSKASAVTAGLLKQIEENGMDQDSYNNAATLLKKLKVTLNSFTEERKPVTQAAQSIVKAFTAQENALDVTKSDTDAYKLKKHMDEYATKIETEKRRKAEEERVRLEKEREINTVQISTMAFLQKVCAKSVDMIKERLKAYQDSLSLENYDTIRKEILAMDTRIPESLLSSFDVEIRTVYIGKDEKKKIVDSIMELDEWEEMQMDYFRQAGVLIQESLAYLPTLKKELEEIAKASAERAEELRKEKLAREFAEKQRIEKEKREAQLAIDAEELEKKKKAEMQAQFDFGASMAELDSTVKAKNSYRIELKMPVGLLEVTNFWVAGQQWPMDPDKALKVSFERMVKYAEGEATKNNSFIKSEYVKYIPITQSKL